MSKEDYAVECLSEILRGNGLDGVLTPEQISVVAKEMAEGLSMLHELGSYHPDRPSKNPEIERLEKKILRLEMERDEFEKGWRVSIARRNGYDPDRVRIIDPVRGEYDYR